MMRPSLPAHASPALTPSASPKPQRPQKHLVSDIQLDDNEYSTDPPPLVSPTITPPSTPPGETSQGQRHDRQPRGIPIGPQSQQSHGRRSSLVEVLPEVECEVRARIPTVNGEEMWLHLYHNNVDDKEHLAIVFGSNIRSRSLDAPRPGETERDRMVRGAYIGTLYPGRTSSKVDDVLKDGIPSSRGSSTSLHRMGAAAEMGQVETSMSALQHSRPREDPPLVRIHSECYTGETVWSARCDCGEQLDEAQRLMSLPVTTPASTPVSQGQHPLHERLPPSGGVIIYLRQEGRGIGLLSKLKAYNLQDLGHDTMEANLLLRHPGDARSYGLATAMLLDLGLGGERGIRLLTNNPDKVHAVEGPHREVRVIERVPMVPIAWKTGGKEGINSPEIEKYLSTKIEKFKHMLSSNGG